MKLNLGLYKSAGINGFPSNTLQFNYIIKIASFFFSLQKLYFIMKIMQ